jgi:hypothetical protein
LRIAGMKSWVGQRLNAHATGLRDGVPNVTDFTGHLPKIAYLVCR